MCITGEQLEPKSHVIGPMLWHSAKPESHVCGKVGLALAMLLGAMAAAGGVERPHT
jgi:hypothetical protein